MPAHLFPRSVLVASLGAAVLAQTGLAQTGLAQTGLAQAGNPPASIEAVLPASTHAVFRFGGLQACSDAAGAVPMSAVVNAFLAKVPAETRGKLFDEGLDRGGEQVREGLQRVGIAPADLRAVLGRPMVLALGRLTIEGMGPSVTWVIDAGDCRPAFDRVLAAAEGQAAQHGASIAAEPVQIAGHDLRRLQATPEGPPVFVGAMGGYLVVGNSRGWLRDFAAALAGQGPTLAAGSALVDNTNRLPAPALVSLFVDARPFRTMLEPHLPYEAADFAAALGLGGLDSLYLGTTANQAGGTDVAHLGVGGSADGVLKALGGKPVELSFASLCSKNTVAFAAGSCDLPAVVDAVDRLLQLLPGQAGRLARADLLRDLQRGMRGHGTTPAEVDRLLRAFGNQIGIAISLEKGAVPKPELLVRVTVRDPSRIAPLLQKLEAAVAEQGQLEWKSRQVGGQTIRFCNVPVPDAELQLSPCYVLRDGDLLFGSDVQALVRAMKQAEHAEESLAAQPDFANAAATANGASGILHLRLFRAAELGWRSVEQLAYPQLDARREEVGFGSESLPDAEAVAKALGTSTFLYTVDARGFTVHNQGTLAVGALLAGLGAAVDEVLHRACGRIF